MKKPKIPFLSNRLGVSYTISAVIMTVTTISLVLVASSYAYQILEQQRGVSEFEVAQKSILLFDDALENVAWKLYAARSARFTVKYGQLELIPNDHPKALTLAVNVTVGSNTATYSNSTGFIRYSIKNRYANFWEGYQSYILGDENLIVTNSTQSYGRAFIEQVSGWVNITLNYRARAMRTSVIEVNNETVNYVEVWIIRIVTGNWSTYNGDFDLIAKCIDVTTETYPQGGDQWIVNEGDNATITVQLGESEPSSAFLSLETGKVVINFVVSEMKVTV